MNNKTRALDSVSDAPSEPAPKNGALLLYTQANSQLQNVRTLLVANEG